MSIASTYRDVSWSSTYVCTAKWAHSCLFGFGLGDFILWWRFVISLILDDYKPRGVGGMVVAGEWPKKMTQRPEVCWMQFHVATNISWEGSLWACFQNKCWIAVQENFPVQIENDMKGEGVVGDSCLYVRYRRQWPQFESEYLDFKQQ